MLDEKCVGAPIMEARERQLPVDWIEERFRVDRRKLEEMILGKDKGKSDELDTSPSILNCRT